MKTLKGRLGEERYYEFDFSNEPEIVAGDTLTGTPTVTATSYSGPGTPPTIGTIAIASGNKLVSCLLTPVSNNTTWLMKCLCHTAGGSILAREGLYVINDR